MGETLKSKRPIVMVVEDEAIIRMGLATDLSAAGFDVIEAANADDALAILSAGTEIAVIVTDVEMAGTMDGVRLAWLVRDRWPPIHLLVVSGRRILTEADLPERSRFFSKPYLTERVIGTIRDLIQ